LEAAMTLVRNAAGTTLEPACRHLKRRPRQQNKKKDKFIFLKEKKGFC